MPTISQAIREGVRKLQESGVEQGRRTAGLILCHVMGIDRTRLLTKFEEQVSESQYRTYLDLLDRRAAGEPTQYLIGHQEFYGLDFLVTPAVLIPRPETELLVERALTIVDEYGLSSPLIADIGTGSGCIAITLAVKIAGARLIATDAHASAIDVARENASIHGVTSRIEFVEGDLLGPLAGRGLESSIDLLVSNPPYIDEGVKGSIQREVLEWEPHGALFAQNSGLEFYERLLADGPGLVVLGGYLIVEIGFGQLESIERMVRESSSWKVTDVARDLQNIPRTLTLQRL